MSDDTTQDGGQPVDYGVSPRLAQVMEAALRERGLLPGSEKPAEHAGPFVPGLGTDTTPAWDESQGGISSQLAEAMRVVVTPVEAEAYDIGPSSKFAMNLPTYQEQIGEDGQPVLVQYEASGWNDELEADSRQWMSRAGLSHMEAALVQQAFTGAMRKAPTPEQVERNEAVIQSELVREYGTKAGEALAGARRLVAHAGGQKLKDFLNRTGLGSDPAMVRLLVKRAAAFGFFKA